MTNSCPAPPSRARTRPGDTSTRVARLRTRRRWLFDRSLKSGTCARSSSVVGLAISTAPDLHPRRPNGSEAGGAVPGDSSEAVTGGRLRLQGVRQRVGLEAAEGPAGLAEGGNESPALDLRDDGAALRRVLAVGCGPVDPGHEPAGGVVGHAVDRVDDLLARELRSRRLETPDEEIGVHPACQ